MKAAAFDYHAPATVDEALELLSMHGDDARILAGGQSLLPQMTARRARPSVVVDINRIAHAERPSVADGRLSIPPLMRHVDFEPDVAGGPLGPLMAELARGIGTLPVRLRGTYCGAVANADPASAIVLASVVTDAAMVARSQERGTRSIAAAAFYAGRLATRLEDDEMLTEVQVPLLPDGAAWGFSAIGTRAAGWPLSLALAVWALDGEAMTDVRIGVGGVEATARRLPEAERMLEGRAPSQHLFHDASTLAADHVAPDGDPAAVAWQRDLVHAAVARALGASAASRRQSAGEARP